MGLAVALLAGTAATALWLGPEMRREFLPVILASVGAIYSGFALAERHLRSLLVEVAYGVATVGVALLGMWYSPYWLAAGYLAHGVWDVLHHRSSRLLASWTVPRWYVLACLVYDWPIGVLVIFAL